MRINPYHAEEIEEDEIYSKSMVKKDALFVLPTELFELAVADAAFLGGLKYTIVSITISA